MLPLGGLLAIMSSYSQCEYPRKKQGVKQRLEVMCMSIEKYERYWAVIDTDGTLVYLCVYKCGSQ